MKKIVVLGVLVVFGIAFLPGKCQSAQKPEKWFDSEQKKVGYVLGWDVGSSLKNISGEVNIEAFLMGIEDAFKESKRAIKEEEADRIKAQFSKKMQEERMKKNEIEVDKNKKESASFLAANKIKKGVITTASGLQYKVLMKGKGTQPKSTDQVKVNYKGTLINGSEFDSSYKRGKPAVFQLNRVIPGWTEGIQLMSPGSKYIFYIPPELAYGERRAGKIGPNSMLIFEVELLGIEKEK